MKYLIFVALVLWGTTSCDVVKEPYTKDFNPLSVDTNRPNILLEEFTGHTCIHCPAGSKTAKGLENNYPHKVFVVAIHAGELAKPEAGDKYNYDFRINEGIELDEFYKVSKEGLPRGMINRTPYQNKQTIHYGNWANAIVEYWNKNKTRQLDIEISADYDSAANKITANVNLNYFASQSKQNKLSVWIVEDNIINWQKNFEEPVDIPNYQHNDVFRYSFNGAWGENVGSGTLPVGFQFSKDYSLTIPSDKDWNVANMRIIAFVYDDTDGVKQVIDAKVVE
jgi:hypothetical protein